MRFRSKIISLPLAALQCALSVYVVVCQGQPACPATETMNKAATLYKEGKYTESLEFIEQELAVNPRSAAAHYLFGNVLVHRNAVPDAVREYTKAISLDPKGTFGRYSREEVARLTGGQPPGQAYTGQIPISPYPGQAPLPAYGGQTPFPAQGGQASVGINGGPAAGLPPAQAAAPLLPPQTGPEDPELAARRRAVMTTAQQTHQQSLNTTDEFQTRINELKRDTDARISALTAEMNNQIAANGNAKSRHGVTYYDPEPLNEIVRADFKDKITAIQAEADRRMDELQRAHDKKQELIEQTGLSVDRALAAPTRPGDIKVVPQGTNLHVRNFETADQPSGDVVPLVAEPGKLSSDSKKSKPDKKHPAQNPN